MSPILLWTAHSLGEALGMDRGSTARVVGSHEIWRITDSELATVCLLINAVALNSCQARFVSFTSQVNGDAFVEPQKNTVRHEVLSRTAPTALQFLPSDCCLFGLQRLTRAAAEHTDVTRRVLETMRLAKAAEKSVLASRFCRRILLDSCRLSQSVRRPLGAGGLSLAESPLPRHGLIFLVRKNRTP